jgi:hypothetical protein
MISCVLPTLPIRPRDLEISVPLACAFPHPLYIVNALLQPVNWNMGDHVI